MHGAIDVGGANASRDHSVQCRLEVSRPVVNIRCNTRWSVNASREYSVQYTLEV